MVSVIMATYNGAQFIEKQMDSIRKQTLLPDEVLLCDDNSTDNTVDIIKSYINKYQLNWKVVINNQNLGYYMNFINGASLVKGDTIYFADQDDIWNLRKIESCEEIFKQDKNIMMVQTNYIFIDQNDNKLQINSGYHRIHANREIVELSLSDMCRFAGSGFTMGFRKNVISYIYDKGLYKFKGFHFHDILVGLSAACLGRCIYLPKVYDKHRLHLSNATQKANESITSLRTKAIQIKNFENRKKYFNTLKELLLNDENKNNFIEKIDILDRYIKFNDFRIKFYNTKKIKYFIKLLIRIKCYYDRRAFFADILFSINADNVIKRYSKNIV